MTESLAELDGFKAGQVWAYQTRLQEPESHVIIGRLERTEVGVVAHIQVNGLRIRFPTSKEGFHDVLQHAPFSTDALRGSVTKLVGEVPVLSLVGFDSGYQEWRRQGGGVFTISVAKAIDYVEETVNKGIRRGF